MGHPHSDRIFPPSRDEIQGALGGWWSFHPLTRLWLSTLSVQFALRSPPPPLACGRRIVRGTGKDGSFSFPFFFTCPTASSSSFFFDSAAPLVDPPSRFI